MFQKIIIIFLILVFTILSQQEVPFAVPYAYSSNEHLLAKQQMSLENRYGEKTINGVFKDNILLTLTYLSGEVTSASGINWEKVRAFDEYEVELQPGEVFAFHDDVLPEYRAKQLITTNARFGAQQGFRSSGYLYGDGVCHLASLITWTAREAGLKVVTRVNHDFANIPEVPKEHGTSIVTTGTSSLNAQMQNLYVENTLDKPVRMVFRYNENGDLSLSIYK